MSLLLKLACSLKPGGQIALLMPIAGGFRGHALASSDPTSEPRRDIIGIGIGNESAGNFELLAYTTRCDSGELLGALVPKPEPG